MTAAVILSAALAFVGGVAGLAGLVLVRRRGTMTVRRGSVVKRAAL
jgi:hypothetical protein